MLLVVEDKKLGIGSVIYSGELCCFKTGNYDI